MMIIRPITFKQASGFINQHHRHHKATVGCKFCVGLFNQENGEMVGCAVCGRPVGRYLDDGLTCEINRLCTDGTKNACSMLYGACCRIAKEMGYEKIITYILESESGDSLKASGWHLEKRDCGGGSWSRKSRPRDLVPDQLSFFPVKQKYPTEKKQRWAKDL